MVKGIDRVYDRFGRNMREFAPEHVTTTRREYMAEQTDEYRQRVVEASTELAGVATDIEVLMAPDELEAIANG